MEGISGLSVPGARSRQTGPALRTLCKMWGGCQSTPFMCQPQSWWGISRHHRKGQRPGWHKFQNKFYIWNHSACTWVCLAFLWDSYTWGDLFAGRYSKSVGLWIWHKTLANLSLIVSLIAGLRSASCWWSMSHFLWHESSEMLHTRGNQEKKEGCHFLSQCRQKVHHCWRRQRDLGWRCGRDHHWSLQAFCWDASREGLSLCLVRCKLRDQGIQERRADVFLMVSIWATVSVSITSLLLGQKHSAPRVKVGEVYLAHCVEVSVHSWLQGSVAWQSRGGRRQQRSNTASLCPFCSLWTT